MKTRKEVLNDVLELLRKLSGDWDYEGEITDQTWLFGDLGLQSLDIVVIATTLQETYGKVIPFTDLFAGVGQRERQDMQVDELVGFVADQLSA